MGYVLAVLEVENVDDGMVVCKTGCIDGNGKPDHATINEKNCVSIDEKFRTGFLKNWELFLNSPEYPLYTLINNIKT